MQHSVGLSEPYFSDLEGRPSSFCNQYLVSSAKVSTQPSAFPANLRHVGVPSAPSNHACEPTARDPHRRPRISPATIEASSGSLRAGRWRGPSALAASVCDGSCWPRAHCFGTASSPEIFRSRSAAADRGGPAMASAVLETWPPGIATPQPLPQPGTRRSSAPHPTPNKTRSPPAPQRRSPPPPARRSQR